MIQSIRVPMLMVLVKPQMKLDAILERAHFSLWRYCFRFLFVLCCDRSAVLTWLLLPLEIMSPFFPLTIALVHAFLLLSVTLLPLPTPFLRICPYFKAWTTHLSLPYTLDTWVSGIEIAPPHRVGFRQMFFPTDVLACVTTENTTSAGKYVSSPLRFESSTDLQQFLTTHRLDHWSAVAILLQLPISV